MQSWYLSICTLCRLLDSMQEIPAQGKVSSEDVLHPDEEGDIIQTGFSLLGVATVMCPEVISLNFMGFAHYGMRRSCGQREAVLVYNSYLPRVNELDLHRPGSGVHGKPLTGRTVKSPPTRSASENGERKRRC